MKNVLLWLVCFVPVCLHAQLFPQLGAQRAGISALTFLKMDVSPRSAALAGSNICLTGDGYSTNTNPATLVESGKLLIAAANTFWSAGINYAFLSGSKESKAGHFGLSLASLSSGAMEVRTEFQPEGTGEYFYANYWQAGLTYSQRLTDMFSYGATIKYVHEQLAEFTANTAVVDLGFLYRTDVKDLSFAVMIQSFGVNSSLKGTKDKDTTFNSNPLILDSYPAPTVFKLGISMIPFKDEETGQELFVSLQLNHPNDNAENLRLGVEYRYRNLLFLRTGYKINVKDQNFPTAGLGLRMNLGRHPLTFDYAVDPLKYLGVVHRIGLSFGLNDESR